MLVQLELGHAGLHVCIHIFVVSRQYAIHPTQVDTDATMNGDDASFNGGPFAKRDDR